MTPVIIRNALDTVRALAGLYRSRGLLARYQMAQRYCQRKGWPLMSGTVYAVKETQERRAGQ